MDDPVVLDKLDTVQRCMKRIREKTSADAAAFSEDVDAQDIISVNLERAVQACVDIAARVLATQNKPAPETMAAAFDELCRLDVVPESLSRNMKKAVGFRNMAVHAYKKIDWKLVYFFIATRLDDFKEFANCILKIP
jgi:uncharacterized protein YutE (UPF0331/DUF86 family)